MMDNITQVSLDWTRLLGFELVHEDRKTFADSRLFGDVGGKVGAKRGDKR